MTIQTLAQSWQFWIGLVLALFFGFFAYKSSRVTGKKVATFPKGLVVFVAIILLFGALWISNVGTLVGMSSAFAVGGVSEGTTPGTVDTNLIDGKCLTADTTTVTLSAQDKYLSTAVGGTHRYRLNGASALTVADAGTFTASPGDKLEVLWQNGTIANAYFSKVGEYTVPCKGTYTPTEADGSPVKLVMNGSLTSRFFNTNNVLIDSGATNQTLSAGDIKSLKSELEGGYQKELPYGLVAVIEYNKVSMDDVLFTVGGTELPSASVPQAYVPQFGVNSSLKAYLIPAITSNSKFEWTTVLDADDTVNPQGGAVANVNVTLYPRNLYINEKNGGAFEGPSAEDENRATTKSVVFYAPLGTD